MASQRGDESIEASRHAQHSLGRSAIAGARLTAVARAFAETAAFGAVIVTSRLLTPAEFGQAAFGIVVAVLAIGITQLGFGAPIVQRPEVTPRQVTTAHWLSIAFGVVVTAAVVGVGGEILAGQLDPAAIEAVQWASAAFLCAGLGAVPTAVLQRRLDFSRLAKIDGFASVAGTSAMVALAAAGAGPAALVAGPVLTVTLTSAAVLVFCPEVWQGRFTLSETRALVRFGLPAAGSGLMSIATRNADYVILAAKLPASQVGFYYRAYQLGIEYQSKISGVMLRVALPVFSRAETLAQLRTYRSRIGRVHSVVLFPPLVVLLALAPYAIPFLFGDAWIPAVVPAQIMAVAGLATVVGTGTGPIVTAAGHPGALLIGNIIDLTTTAITVWLLSSHGIQAVCWGIAAVRFVMLVGGQWLLVQRLVGIPVREALVSDLVPATVCSLLLLASALAASAALDALQLQDSLIFAASAAVSLAVYVVAMRSLFEDAWTDVTTLLRRPGSAGGSYAAA